MPYKDPAAQRAYQLERMKQARTEWLLANGPCNCGSWEDLQVDHIDPNLKVSHRIWSWSPARRAAELAKCQTLCLPCHKRKTREEWFEKKAPHGTNARYVSQNHRCRCSECRDAHRITNAKYRKG